MTPNLSNGDGPVVPARSAPAVAAAAETLRHLRTHGTQETLGVADAGGLLWPGVQATVASAAVLAALTVGPYLMAKSGPAAATNTPAPAESDAGKAEPPKPGTPTPPAPATPDAGGKPVAAGDPGKPPVGTKPEAVLEKLGENTTKTAGAKVNPLDKKEDDIFKDLDRK